MSNLGAITTLGDLRRAIDAGTVRRRSVHEEVRENLILKLRRGGTLFTSWSTRCSRSTTSSCSA